MVERNGFKFDQRVYVPVTLSGFEVIKLFGQPFVVSEALPGEPRLGSGMTERQAREAGQKIREIGISPMLDQKRQTGCGLLRHDSKNKGGDII